MSLYLLDLARLVKCRGCIPGGLQGSLQRYMAEVKPPFPVRCQSLQALEEREEPGRMGSELATASSCYCNCIDLHGGMLQPLHSSLDSQNLRFCALATAVTRTLKQLPSCEAHIYKIHTIAERAIWQPP